VKTIKRGLTYHWIAAGEVLDATESFSSALYMFMVLAVILILIISLAAKKGEGFNTVNENSAVT